MVQMLTVGLGAGAAAALLLVAMLAALLSGASLGLAILLGSIAPLPILIAAIGWNHLAGFVAAWVGGTVLALTLSGGQFFPFLIGIGLPAWWLGYLALLARPALAHPAPGHPHRQDIAPAPPGADDVEWYPVGRLVVWAALLAAAAVAAALLSLGLNAESIQGALRQGVEKTLRWQLHIAADAPLEVPGLTDPKRLLDLSAVLFPPAAAVFATITKLVNLWLAARVVKISGRLRRPWPDLAAISFPPAVAVLLAAAIGGSFLSDLIGILSWLLAVTLLTAYAALGFAVLHKITGGMLGRGFVLTAAYTAVGILIWPILVMTLLGLADTLLDVRGRMAAWRGPSTPDT